MSPWAAPRLMAEEVGDRSDGGCWTEKCAATVFFSFSLFLSFFLTAVSH